jgi:methyl-accepting chemotaxis protein
MKTWTIGRRITVGFTAVIAVTLALGGFALSRLITIRGHSEQIARQSIPAIELVYRAEGNAKTYDTLVYKHIGSEDAADMAHLESDLSACTADNDKVYAELDKMLTDEKSRALLDNVKSARAAYVNIRNQVLVLSREATNNAKAYAFARSQMDPASTQYHAALDTLVDTVRTATEESSANIQSAVQASNTGIFAGLAVACVLGAIITLVITRGTSKILNQVAQSLNDGSSQVASAAGQVSSASQTLAQGAGEQAASIEETSSSLEELSSMTKRNAENAQKANELAKQARLAADKGSTDMQTMSAAMDAIKTSSDDIAKIIKTIDEIAFQTNILALNAAVEAARAGEAGMGFAVVADEVRTLAQRSAQAAKETALKIEGAISKTAQGVLMSTQVGHTLDEIVTKARQVDELAAEVAGASREQTEGINQINSAVGQMDRVTQANAATAEESAAASEELNAQATEMKRAVAELLTLVGRIPASEAAPIEISKPKPVPAKKPAAPIKSNYRNGHHSPVKPAVTADRSSEIPLENSFTEF